MNIFNKTKINNIKEKQAQIPSSGALELLFTPSISQGDVVFGNSKALSFYEKSVYVNKAIDKRAEKVSEIEFYLEDKKGNKITDHELLNLLAKPNNFQTGEQFINLWQKYKDLYGEVYALLLSDREFLSSNKKLELRLLNPLKCKPEYDNNWQLTSIEYEGVSKKYSANEIIFDFRTNPRNQFRGASLIQAGANIIETNIELDRLNYKLINNGGKVEGLLNFKAEQIEPAQLEEFKQKYKEQLAEMVNYGNVIFMGGDAEYQRINLTPEELGYLATRKMSLNDICILTDVPKVLLNSVDDIKYDNAEASLKIFLRETIKPLMRQITTKLNEKVELIPKEFELKFVDPAPEDLDLKLKLNDNGAKNYYLTPNELRRNVGYEDIEGGDDILVPFTMTSQRYTETIEEEKAKTKKKELAHPLKSFENRRKYLEKRLIIQDRQEDIFEKELKKYIKDQKERVLSYLEGKRRSKNMINNAFDMNTEISIGKLMLMPLLKQYMLRAGGEATELVLGTNQFIWTNAIESALNNRVDFFLGEINKNTFKKLNEELLESLEAGESRDLLVNRVSNYFDETYKGRYNTIARTEVHNSIQGATIEGYKQAGMPIKIWVSVMDSATRDTHAYMDGEERPINMPFSNGLMFPGDPNGSADETINCRCSI